MNLYAESSAVLAWLFDESSGTASREALASAELIITSELTLIECDRVLVRASAIGEIAEADAASLRAVLRRAAAHWVLLRLEDEVSERARRAFPVEPVRTLDAIHLSSALVARSAVHDVSVLSLDSRIRANSAMLGLPVLPA